MNRFSLVLVGLLSASVSLAVAAPAPLPQNKVASLERAHLVGSWDLNWTGIYPFAGKSKMLLSENGDCLICLPDREPPEFYVGQWRISPEGQFELSVRWVLAGQNTSTSVVTYVYDFKREAGLFNLNALTGINEWKLIGVELTRP